MDWYMEVCEARQARPLRWVVTGVAGFIGSHLLQRLLELGQNVVGVDNFSNGHPGNLEDVRDAVGSARWGGFNFIEGDIRDLEVCRRACGGADRVLHQAALGSVPRSLDDPITSHQSNVDGFLNMLVAARDAGVGRMVYASSSSVYGDDATLPKLEGRTGQVLSPYALTKLINEQYAKVFAKCYGFRPIGLRYFNVFGPRQDPNGPYAAVIPKWLNALLAGQAGLLFGDGGTSRDFCYVANVVQANLLAAEAPESELGKVFNVSYGGTTSLSELYRLLQERVAKGNGGLWPPDPILQPPRAGDIRHSQADLGAIQAGLGYAPTHSVPQGLDILVPWFAARHGRAVDA